MEWFGAASGFPWVDMRRTDQPCALFSLLWHQTTGVVTKYTSIITIIIIIIGLFLTRDLLLEIEWQQVFSHTYGIFIQSYCLAR